MFNIFSSPQNISDNENAAAESFDFNKKRVVVEFRNNKLTIPFSWVKEAYVRIVKMEEIGLIKED